MKHMIKMVVGLMLVCGYIKMAFASALNISPIHIYLSAKQPIATLHLRNQGDSAIVLQLQPSTWTRNKKDEGVYDKTKDILVAPPVVSIAPGKEQLVRVALRRLPDKTQELTYRIFIQEILPKTANNYQVRTALRLGVPVYVEPLVAQTDKLQWSVTKLPNNMVRVGLVNSGNAHIQLNQIAIMTLDKKTVFASQNIGKAVLEGQKISWDIKLKEPITTNEVDVAAVTPTTVIDSTVAVK